MSTFVQSMSGHISHGLICLDGSSEFIQAMIVKIGAWVRNEWKWVVICPSLGRGGLPIKEIEGNRIL